MVMNNEWFLNVFRFSCLLLYRNEGILDERNIGIRPGIGQGGRNGGISGIFGGYLEGIPIFIISFIFI